MDRDDFLKLMCFPPEWEAFDMYPEELAVIQISGYQPGHESASEHDRCGAFHWWLKKEPAEPELKKLMCLASIDPDKLMGEDIRTYIQKSINYTEAVGAEWRS